MQPPRERGAPSLADAGGGAARTAPHWLGRWHWVGKLWAAPVTLLGLAVGVLGLPLGSRVRLEHNAVVFHRYPFGPGGAMVLGNVILNTLPDLDVRVPTYAARALRRRDAGLVPAQDHVLLADHERAHTYQYEALGLLFLPLYLLGGGPVAGNPFERAADRYARTAAGWWPCGGAEG